MKKDKLCLVCSSGGHFIELYSLEAFWKDREHFWVTFPGADTEVLLKNEKKYWGYHPTNRNILNFIRNLLLAIIILKKERPDVLVSTGAGIGAPFIYVAKFMGIKTIYIESLTFTDKLSLTGKLVYFAADHFLVQWKALADRHGKAKFEGNIL